MLKKLLLLCLMSLSPFSGASALDLPVYLDFNIGFPLRVVPGPGDASRALCLGVVTDKVVTDKLSSLVVTGVIINFGDAPCEGVEMRFAVDSHVGIGKSLGRAAVTPDCIPPGGVATFNLHMSLDSRNPRFAMYAVTARSPVLHGQTPDPVGDPAAGR